MACYHAKICPACGLLNPVRGSACTSCQKAFSKDAAEGGMPVDISPMPRRLLKTGITILA